MNKDLIKKRKKYFATLFSIFIWFALLIILKIPLKPDFYIFSIPSVFILLLSITPTILLLNRKKRFNLLLAIAYLPALVGFITSVVFNNSLYFLISFPIFLLNYAIIFPKR